MQPLAYILIKHTSLYKHNDEVLIGLQWSVIN